MARDKLKWVLAVYVFFLSAYFITFRGYFYSVDAQVRLEVAESMVREGDFRASGSWGVGSAIVKGRNGNYYPVYWTIGQSLTFIPAVLAGDALKTAVPSAPAREVEKLLAVVPVVLFAAGTALLVFLIAEKLALKKRTAFAAAVIYAFGTVAWYYSKASFEAAQETFLVTAGAYFFLVAVTGGGRRGRHALLAGAFLGGAILTRKATVVAALLLAVTWIIYDFANGEKFPARAKNVLKTSSAFLVSPVLAVFFNLAFNYYRFGDLFIERTYLASGVANGEAPLFSRGLGEGLLTLLVSPGQGLFVFNPCLVLGVFALLALIRAKPVFWLWFVAYFTATAIFHGKLLWEGIAHGPKYLAPVVPLLVVGVAKFFDLRLVKTWRLLKWPAYALIAASVFIQLCSVCVPPWRYHNYRLTRGYDYFPATFHIEESPIIWNPIMLYQVLTFDPADYTSPEIPREQMTPQQYLNTIQMNSLDFYWVLFPKFGYPKVLFYIPLGLSVAVCLGSLYYLLRGTRFLGKSPETVRSQKSRNLKTGGTATPRP